VVVYDCAGDTVVLAGAATNPQSAIDKAVYYFQQQGKCCRSPISRPAGVAHGGDAG
jgi:hypothetical protein